MQVQLILTNVTLRLCNTRDVTYNPQGIFHLDRKNLVFHTYRVAI